uniref:Uncharacterized protein n=1 Tax=Glossina brevipalpis TaxID=37001 RepID=A0A1A9WIM2_9MUSC
MNDNAVTTLKISFFPYYSHENVSDHPFTSFSWFMVIDMVWTISQIETIKFTESYHQQYSRNRQQFSVNVRSGIFDSITAENHNAYECYLSFPHILQIGIIFIVVQVAFLHA